MKSSPQQNRSETMTDRPEEDARGLMTERVVGGLLAAAGFATAFWLIPSHTELTPTAALPARAVPTVAAIGIAICGLVQAFKPIPIPNPAQGVATKTALAISICALTWVGLAFVGFEVTASLLAIGLMLLMGERRPLWLAIGGIVLPILIWTVFEIVLRRPLP